MKLNKKNRRASLKPLSTSDFWIEYITLYFSIFVVTIGVQMLFFKIELPVVSLFLLKSLITTIPNIIVIMYGRRVELVKKTRILKALVYAFSSLPYLELLILFIYKKDIYFSFEILLTYIFVYFCVGFFVDNYILFSKKILHKIFYGDV